MENEPPEGTGEVHKAGVPEEFGEITSHIGRRGGIGTAEIYKKHPDLSMGKSGQGGWFRIQ